MKINVIVIAVVVLLTSTALIAGCLTSNTSTPTPSATSSLFTQVSPLPSVKPSPSPSAGPKDVAVYFEGLLKEMKFAIKQPLSHGINTIGNDVYRGTVARGTTTATVTIETCDNIHDTQQRALDYRNDFIGKGYVTRDDQSTYWSGVTQTGEAWIIVDTTDMYVMAFNY